METLMKKYLSLVGLIIASTASQILTNDYEIISETSDPVTVRLIVEGATPQEQFIGMGIRDPNYEKKGVIFKFPGSGCLKMIEVASKKTDYKTFIPLAPKEVFEKNIDCKIRKFIIRQTMDGFDLSWPE
jgi:hypothetical protein